MEQNNLNNTNSSSEPEKTGLNPSQGKAEPSSVKKDKKSSKKTVSEQQNNNSKGLFLKEARLKKGLTLESVHEATKVPMDALRAIEEGYNVKILSPFYIKGFMKIYAKYLEVDVGEVVDDYKKEKLPKKVKYSENEFDFQQWSSKLLTKKQKQQIVIVVGGILALFLLFKILSFIGRGISALKRSDKTPKVEKIVSKKPEAVRKIIVRKPTDAKSGAVNAKESAVESGPKAVKKRQEVRVSHPVVVRPAVNKEVKTVTRVAEAQEASPSGISSIVQSSKKVVLTVRAQKNSWLTVKADGQVVFQSTLRRGSVETWVADKDIEISGKNISYLEFELNGKMIGTLGRKDRRAKKLTVTKDGLKVAE